MKTAEEWQKTLSKDLEQEIDIDDELLDLLNRVSAMKEAGGRQCGKPTNPAQGN